MAEKLSFYHEGRVAYWQEQLGITRIDVFIERLNESQVTDETGNPGAELVGVVRESPDRATIYHTRDLEDDDFVHELMHVKKPEWSEEEVNTFVGSYLSQRATNDLPVI